MPGLITHYICGQAVLNTLPERDKQRLLSNRQLYNIGSQGPDIFFYYLPALIRDQLVGLGSKMHKGGVRSFIHNMVVGLEKLPEPEKDAVFAYLCGYLTHYALDASAHPYIYYKTGFRQKGKPIKGIRYSIYHRNFETSLDTLMLKLTTSEKPRDVKLWQLIKTTKKEARSVSKVIGRSIKKTYGVPVSGKLAYRAMFYMSSITRLLQSRSGKRKILMEFAEDFTIGKGYFSSLIHEQEVKDGIDYLNLRKENWFMPWDNKTIMNHTFVEMFERAIDDSLEMINALSAYLRNEITMRQLLCITGNNSLATGLDSGQKVEFAYSDVVYR